MVYYLVRPVLPVVEPWADDVRSIKCGCLIIIPVPASGGGEFAPGLSGNGRFSEKFVQRICKQ